MSFALRSRRTKPAPGASSSTPESSTGVGRSTSGDPFELELSDDAEGEILASSDSDFSDSNPVPVPSSASKPVHAVAQAHSSLSSSSPSVKLHKRKHGQPGNIKTSSSSRPLKFSKSAPDHDLPPPPPSSSYVSGRGSSSSSTRGAKQRHRPAGSSRKPVRETLVWEEPSEADSSRSINAHLPDVVDRKPSLNWDGLDTRSLYGWDWKKNTLPLILQRKLLCCPIFSSCSHPLSFPMS